MTPHEALALTRQLTTLAVREALAAEGGRLAWSRLERLRDEWPSATPADGALERALGAVHPGSVEERALLVGLAVRDALLEAQLADVRGRTWKSAKDAEAPELVVVRKRYAGSLERLASARETAAGALARLTEGLDATFSPAVGEAVAALTAALATPVPAFDSEENLWTWPPGERWISDVVRCVAKLQETLQWPRVRHVLGPPTEGETRLLAEIARRPADESLRLEWAGLAEARGDPRAAFVRAQLKRRANQRLLRSSRYPPGALETHLLAAHPEWTDPVRRLGATSADLSGGFVECITIDAATLLARHAELLAAAPIRGLTLTGDVTLVSELVASGALANVVWLVLAGLPVDAQTITHLAALPKLRALSLQRCGLTDALVEQLWRELPRLVLCELGQGAFTALVTHELTHQELSRWEWFLTERALGLERAWGSRSWVVPPDDAPNLDFILARLAERGER